MDLQAELEKAEAEAARIRRAIAAGPCQEYGHDWKSIGGCNAGCGYEFCCCSVPVSVCTKCGDCDYGETPEADQIRADCEERSEFEAAADEAKRRQLASIRSIEH